MFVHNIWCVIRDIEFLRIIEGSIKIFAPALPFRRSSGDGPHDRTGRGFRVGDVRVPIVPAVNPVRPG